jgi:hypothetical protein
LPPFGVDKSQNTNWAPLEARRALPDLVHLAGTLRHLAFGIGRGRRIDQPHIQRGLAAVIGDAQHVVLPRIDTVGLEPLRARTSDCT